jgi:hypothetical protein
MHSLGSLIYSPPLDETKVESLEQIKDLRQQFVTIYCFYGVNTIYLIKKKKNLLTD